MKRNLLCAVAILAGLATSAWAQDGAGLKVRHIHIWVKDVAKTKAFYEKTMGFKVSHETPGENVEFNDGTLWFGRFKGAGAPETNGITIGLGTSSVQAAYDALKKNGATVPPPSEAHGEWHFVLKDPDGYSIEVEGPK